MKRPSFQRFCRLLGIACLALIAMALPSPARASVTLVSYDAIATPSRVNLRWETATEIDTAGFRILRGMTQTGPRSPIAVYDESNQAYELVPPMGDGQIGWTYQFHDPNVTVGQIYWYLLEAIDTSQHTESYGPKAAAPGLTPTPTPVATPTPTRTPTPTATATSVAPTRTPTRTATPTSLATAQPAPTQLMATASVAPQPTATPTPGPQPTSANTPTRPQPTAATQPQATATTRRSEPSATPSPSVPASPGAGAVKVMPTAERNLTSPMPLPSAAATATPQSTLAPASEPGPQLGLEPPQSQSLGDLPSAVSAPFVPAPLDQGGAPPSAAPSNPPPASEPLGSALEVTVEAATPSVAASLPLAPTATALVAQDVTSVEPQTAPLIAHAAPPVVTGSWVDVVVGLVLAGLLLLASRRIYIFVIKGI